MAVSKVRTEPRNFDARVFAMAHELLVTNGALRFLKDRTALISSVIEQTRRDGVEFQDFEGTRRRVQRVEMNGRVSTRLDHKKMRDLYPAVYQAAVKRTNPDAAPTIVFPKSNEWNALKSEGWNHSAAIWRGDEEIRAVSDLAELGGELTALRASQARLSAVVKSYRASIIELITNERLRLPLEGTSTGKINPRQASPTYEIDYDMINNHPFARSLLTYKPVDPYVIIRTPKVDADENDLFADPFSFSE